MKRIFALATAVATILVCGGCEEETLPAPELKLTSESTMSFTAEGGNGVITYSLENPIKDIELKVSSDKDFIHDYSTEQSGQVTFSVDANETTETRSATITVSYDAESFTVAVNQAAKEEDPEPEADVVFEATTVNGFYFGDGEYEFYVSQVGFDEDGYYKPDAVYFSFVELMAAAPAENAEVVTVPAGTYTLDLGYSYQEGTFTENSTYFKTTETGSQTGKQYYAEATLVVGEDGSMTFNATDEDGTTYLMTLPAGEYPLTDESGTSGPDGPITVEFDEMEIYAYYYGEYPGFGMGDWYIEAIPASGNGWGIILDILSPVLGFDPANFLGTYKNQYEWAGDATVGLYAGVVIEMENGVETGVEYELTSGDLVISEGYFGSTALSVSNGNVNFEWMAVLEWEDMSEDYSEVTEITADFNSTNTSAACYFYGEANGLTGVDEYVLELAGEDGNYLTLEILTDNKVGANELPSLILGIGEPDASTTDLVWAGALSEDYSIYPSFWGMLSESGYLSDAVILENGSVMIQKNEDGTYTIDTEAYGTNVLYGNSAMVTSTYTGEISFIDESTVTKRMTDPKSENSKSLKTKKRVSVLK